MNYRQARSTDYPNIVKLVNYVFGIKRSVDWFIHFHLLNPAGKSILLIAEDPHGHVVSYRSLVRVDGYHNGRHVACAQLADASTHPDYRGKGIFGKLTAMALEQFFDSGGEMVFGFPGPMSYPIYTKKFDFVETSSFQQCIYPLSLPGISRNVLVPYHRFFAGKHNACKIQDPSSAVERLVVDACSGFCFHKDADLLKWRLTVPGREYHIFILDERNFAIVGFTVRNGYSVSTVVDSRSSTQSNLRQILACIASWSHERKVDGVYTWIQPDLRWSYIMGGYVPLWRRTRLIVKFRDASVGGLMGESLRRSHISLIDTDAY